MSISSKTNAQTQSLILRGLDWSYSDPVPSVTPVTRFELQVGPINNPTKTDLGLPTPTNGNYTKQGLAVSVPPGSLIRVCAVNSVATVCGADINIPGKPGSIKVTIETTFSSPE